MALQQELKEVEGKLQDRQGKLAKIFEEAGDNYDMSKVKCEGEGLSSVQVVEKINAYQKELDELGEKREKLQNALKSAEYLKNEPTKTIPHPEGGEPEKERKEYKSIGQRMVEHEVFKGWQARKSGVFEIKDYGLAELKTLFETTAGWAPESTRSGKVVEAVTRPIQVTDLIPSGQTGQAAYVYMEETTRTHGAQETSEGGTYKESTFELTQRSKSVVKITDSVPVTDEQLEDVAGVQSYLDNRLRFGIMQRLDNQILNGDGNAPNLDGILNNSDLQTQAKGTDPVPDAIYKAMTKIRVTGRAMPSGIIMHPNDWQAVRLLRTADGIYIWGNPSEPGPDRMWGLPVSQADSLSENTGLVGDFANYSQLFERRGIILEMGFTGTQFVEGKQTMRASMRVVLVVYRGSAFCEVTGI